MTKTKHPNKGHSPNNGQRPMYQSVRYSESPLYMNFIGAVWFTRLSLTGGQYQLTRSTVNDHWRSLVVEPVAAGLLDTQRHDFDLIANMTDLA